MMLLDCRQAALGVWPEAAYPQVGIYHCPGVGKGEPEAQEEEQEGRPV